MKLRKFLLIFGLVPIMAIISSVMFLFQGCAKPDPSDYGLVESNPMLIRSAQDFANIKPTYKYVKMEQNVELSDIDDIYTSKTFLFENFNGEFDGNGKTIKFDRALMPADEISELNSRLYLFEEFNGTLKNVTLEFDTIGTPYTFAGVCTQETTFENVTTIGDIFITKQIAGYSPIIISAHADIAFKNCDSMVNIEGGSYGSAFLGGCVWNPTGEVYQDKETTTLSSPATTGYVKDLKVSFVNCVNHGRIAMANGAMFYGNGFAIPVPENLTIENCYNLGTIVGALRSGLFSSNVIGVESNLYPYRHPVTGGLKEYNDLAEQVNASSYEANGIEVQQQGSISTLVFANDASLVMGGDRVVKIKQEETAKSAYSYRLRMSAFLKDVNGNYSYSVLFDKNFSSSADEIISTDIKYLNFVGKNFITETLEKTNFVEVLADDQQDNNYSVTETSINATSTEGTKVKVYIIEYNGQSYYYFDFKDSNGNTVDYEATFHGEVQAYIAMTKSVLVYNSNDKIVGELSAITIQN